MNDVAWIEARTIGSEAARETWALAARHLLADVAGEYHAVISVAELADAVQQRTRVRNRQSPSMWLGDVLYRVALECQSRGEPLLGALCVGPDGLMSGWYADTVLTVRGETVADPEEHAARERLDCYRRHGADLPAGGGEPALPPRPQPAPARARAPRQPRAAAGARTQSTAGSGTRSAAKTPARRPTPPPPRVCPTCFMALPATGHCDNCD